MEPSKEAIAVRITRLNRQILGKVTSGSTKISKQTIDREALFDALTALYDECNDDPVKRTDDLVRVFVDKYRSTLAELRRARVCISDFEILQTIGRGYFGEVHMVREKQTSDVYALKTVKKELARRRVTGAEDERDVLATATSPWLPRLQYAFQDASNLYLVMELCSGGDLAGLLARRNHPLSERDAAFYVCEVAHALKALHAMGYVHRDIKPHNILLDRCGHVKLADFGSCVRLSGGAGAAAGGTPDYVAPELLAAAHCASTHAVCSRLCRDIVSHAISACDYWSLGVVAFELVTMRRPFSTDEDDSMAQILSNIQKYESSADPQPPFPSLPEGPSPAWRALVRGLLRAEPSKRYTYLDTLQHPALAHIAVHSVRDQPPPWVPLVRGAEDATFLPAPERVTPPPCATPFRTRPPFAGQLPFVGYSFVAPEENEDSSGGFSTSHDCTAIDLATFKSAEKLAAMRSREITSLQNRLAAAEAGAGAAAERARRDADAEAERLRAKLQAEITALSLQNKRLERQIEIEKEERMALERTNQELTMGVAERNSTEARSARAEAERAARERDAVRGDMARLEERIAELQGELTRALAAADAQRMQHMHYKDIIQQVQELRHRKLTEINVRAIDSVAKERAIRRQTLSGGEQESRETAARLANAEASLARETRARDLAEKRINSLDEEYEKVLAQNKTLQAELDDARRQISCSQDIIDHKQRELEATKQQLHEVQTQLAQEKMRVSTVVAQVQELERGMEQAARREAALEEQSARTEARLHERLAAADGRAAAAAAEDARHREKVNTLEQLVRQLEREVSALETRVCQRCTNNVQTNQTTKDKENRDTNGAGDGQNVERNRQNVERKRQSVDKRQDIERKRQSLDDNRQDVDRKRQDVDRNRQDAYSDTESLADVNANVEGINAQLTLLKEQLEKAESQLQTRAEENATLRQEARAANLARWRKEREYNELSLEAKTSAREVKRLEERLSSATEARRKAEQQATALQTEMTTLKPQYERASKDLEQLKEELQRLRKTYETAQAEVDRSRNDIRKLKSELQYSEKRRLHAEEQEEMSARERALLRDEAYSLRNDNTQLVQNNKALQEACSVLEEQLSDLENLADIHELKNKDLEGEISRLRGELESCRGRLDGATRQAAEQAAAAARAASQYEDARAQADHTHAQLKLLQEKLESREARVSELESRLAGAEGAAAGGAAAVAAAARRVRDLQEECAATRTRAHHHHALALQAQAALADAQEELSAAREAAEAATAWWRTRETKTDATLRQQAKLIDFLQAKVEEAGRKKCSLSNKLFGRSGRRNAASPPLRRANRELRDEVDRLRAKLAASNSTVDMNSLPPTPRREKTAKPMNNGIMSIDTPDNAQDDSVLIVWRPDDSRERMRAICADGVLTLRSGERELKARLYSADAKNLPQNEANRAFTVKVEQCIRGPTASVVCNNLPARAAWLARLQAASPAPALASYAPRRLTELQAMPLVALYVEPDAVAIGCVDGLYSLRGPVRMEWGGSEARAPAAVTALCGAGPRALAVCGAALLHAAARALASTLRRARALLPALHLAAVALPDAAPPHLLQGMRGEASDAAVAVAACGRRVVLLAGEGGACVVSRALSLPRAPAALLLTARALYLAADRPLRLPLPAGALEPFAADDPTVAAAAKKHSPPRAILLVREHPLELLICYAECGVFVDELGRRTRSDDPRWSSAVRGWEFVSPFLYVVGEDDVTIVYVDEEAYRSPPCTCLDSASVHSGGSECFVPETFRLKLREPHLLGTAPGGIIVRTTDDECYDVSIVEGVAAFRSIGASVESLESVSDARGSSTELADSMTDLRASHELSRASQDSVEAGTGFLADIRQRARQLRAKNRQEHSDEMIKKILTTEVGLTRSSIGRKSPATTSEFDSDSTESEERTESTKGTSELCAEMFTRQVRFQ